MNPKNKAINEAVEAAKSVLDAQDAKYILAALNYEPEAKSGGILHIEQNASVKDLILVLNSIVKDTTALTAIGVWVGEQLAIAHRQSKDKGAEKPKNPRSVKMPKIKK